MSCPDCGSSVVGQDERGPHIGEWCECGKFLRWVPKSELGLATRSVRSRPDVPPRVRSRVFDRFAYTCMVCGSAPPAVKLQVEHIIPVELAKRFDVYDDLIESDLNLVPMCEECNLGKGDVIYSARAVRLMYRALLVAQKYSDA